MANTCSNCKFWHHWRVVVLADDEPKALGHCVVERPFGKDAVQSIVRGLTAEDFYCVQFQPAVEPVKEKQDGN